LHAISLPRWRCAAALLRLAAARMHIFIGCLLAAKKIDLAAARIAQHRASAACRLHKSAENASLTQRKGGYLVSHAHCGKIKVSTSSTKTTRLSAQKAKKKEGGWRFTLAPGHGDAAV
jgi:hypothetical protein